MICVAISDKDPQKCLEILNKSQMAEIRIDLCAYGIEQINNVFAHPTPTIATCRADETSLAEQKDKLIAAMDAGAKYIDIELEVPGPQRKQLVDYAKNKGVKVIISYHNYTETPGLKQLYEIVDECYTCGAEIAKLATMVTSPSDNAKLMSLYSVGRPVVSLGMGEQGKVSRIIAPLLGAEFTFAAQDDGNITAPGQIKYSAMVELNQQIKSVLNQ